MLFIVFALTIAVCALIQQRPGNTNSFPVTITSAVARPQRLEQNAEVPLPLRV